MDGCFVAIVDRTVGLTCSSLGENQSFDLGLLLKVSPEKSQLWKIKSLYQLNPISTAPPKLDFNVDKTSRHHEEREQRCFPFSDAAFFCFSSATTTLGDFAALLADSDAG